ncbi:efflux RND transporter periplasmic adaptor subunit [Pseudomonadota bacterium]
MFFKNRLQGYLFITTLGLYLFAPSTLAAPPGSRLTPVVVEEAQLRSMAPITWVAGTVASRNEARIAVEVAGRLTSVADVGDEVGKGSPLARVDDILIQADKAEAEAEVTREEASLGFLRREVERLQRLAKQNNAAQTQLDQTLAERDAVTGDLAAAQARLRVVNERIRRTELKAPFAGVVVARFKREGEWASSGDEIVQLVAPNDLEIETTAPLALRPYLAPGMALDIKSGDKVGRAVIRVVVPVADAGSRLISLRMDIAEGSWVAGEPVRLALPSSHVRVVPSVPRDALVLRLNSMAVFTVNEDGSVNKLEVQPGVAMGAFIEITDGINPGDKVIVHGNERLRPGQKVSIKGEAGK